MGEWDWTAWRPEMGWERPDKEAGPDVIEITTELLFNQLPMSRRFLIPDSGQAACRLLTVVCKSFVSVTELENLKMSFVMVLIGQC